MVNIDPRSKYTPRYIGQCIYCGSIDGLSDEHIVPRGLGGPWQLLRASCSKCCDITSVFERDVLREFFILVRTKLRLPSYRPKKRPEAFKFAVKQNGREIIMHVPAADCPTLFMMPLLAKPGYLDNNRPVSGLVIKGMTLHGSDLKQFAAARGIDEISFTAPLRTSFGRLVAKIAYGTVVAQYGLEDIEEAYVLPSILGNKDDVGRWVGSEDDRQPPTFLAREHYLHRIDLILSRENEVLAKVRLFANFQTPEYLVVVGRLKIAPS